MQETLDNKELLKAFALANKDAGVKLYQVGGSVRDELLDRPINDLDLVIVGKRPDELDWESFGFKLIPSHGRSFSIWALVAGNAQRIQLSIPRKREEGRIKLSPTYTIEDDLLARDFTVNAMAVDLATGRLVDPTGRGYLDLKGNLIQAVYPNAFKDDPIRMLRAVRLVADLDFQLSNWTELMVWQDADLLREAGTGSFVERVTQELNKILLSRRPKQALKDLLELRLLQQVLPELMPMVNHPQNEYHKLDVYAHTAEVLEHTTADLTLRWAALLHDMAKPYKAEPRKQGTGFSFIGHDVLGADMAEKLLQRLGQPHRMTKDVCTLVRHHMYDIAYAAGKSMRRTLAVVGKDLMPRLLALKVADMQGSKNCLEREFVAFAAAAGRMLEIMSSEPVATDPRALAVNGYDLIDLGIPEGPELGEILNIIRERVIDDPSLNDKEALLAWVKASLHPDGTLKEVAEGVNA